MSPNYSLADGVAWHVKHFARFVARFRSGAIEKQRLLIPEPLDLTRAEVALLALPIVLLFVLQKLGKI